MGFRVLSFYMPVFAWAAWNDRIGSGGGSAATVTERTGCGDGGCPVFCMHAASLPMLVGGGVTAAAMIANRFPTG